MNYSVYKLMSNSERPQVCPEGTTTVKLSDTWQIIAVSVKGMCNQIHAGEHRTQMVLPLGKFQREGTGLMGLEGSVKWLVTV